MFRRAKSKRRPEVGEYGGLFLINATGRKAESDDSIGVSLSPRDQFYLEVPLKKPVGVLKKRRSDEWTKSRKCMELQRTKRGAMSSHDLDLINTASSLTNVSFEGSSIKHPQASKSRKSSNKAVCTSKNEGLCGIGPEKSVCACLCQSPGGMETVNSEEAPPLRTNYDVSRPKPLKRGPSLFDTLEDEELETYEEAQTTIAVVEVESKSSEEDKTAITNGSKWKLKLPRVRSIPKIGLSKVRSIPKLPSFKLRKKMKRKQFANEEMDDEGYILYYL